MNEITTIDVTASADYEIPDFNYELITNEEDREWAEYAAGSIRFDLGQAVVKVLTAGNMLMEAKSRLPHGQYLPWVEQACGLKPQRAAELIKAANWIQSSGNAGHLESLADAQVLFLLSADATPEDVRQWAMERCAAGNPPSRKEVQERKRQAFGTRQPKPAEAVAVSLIRKGELDRMREAVALAEQAQVVTAAQVLSEIGLRQLPKGSAILGADADFFKLSGDQWVRMPHNGRIDVAPDPEPEPVLTRSIQAVSFDCAAEILGCAATSIRQRISPKQTAEKGTWYKNGYRVTKGARGLVNLEPQP